MMTFPSAGPPYITSKQKRRGDKKNPNLQTNSIYFAEKLGGGVKKSQNVVDVIYGSPLDWLLLLPKLQLWLMTHSKSV